MRRRGDGPAVETFREIFAEVRARFSEDETLELTWVIAEFIALGKVIHVLGLP